MTAPTPGFPPDLEAAVAQALAGHAGYVPDDDSAGDLCDGCYEKLALCEDSPSGSAAALAAHQAVVVMEVIAQHTSTEWGRSRPVSFKNTRRYVSPTSHRPASVEWDETLVARMVLPWQEVEA